MRQAATGGVLQGERYELTKLGKRVLSGEAPLMIVQDDPATNGE